MKINAALVATLLGLAVAKPSYKDVSKQVVQFVECLREALDGGLPSAGIPDHNPLAPSRVISVPIDFLGITGNIMVHDIVLWNITKYIEPAKLTTVETDKGVNVTYEFMWEQFSIDAVWEGQIHDLFGTFQRNGTTTINFKNLIFKGEFDVTFKRDGEVLGHLDKFEVIPECEDVDVVVRGLNIIDGLIKLAVSAALKTFFNLLVLFPVDLFTGGLEGTLNELWMNNATRINEILNNCKIKPFSL